MKRTSAFLELAERIMNEPDKNWFVCNYLEQINDFRPSEELSFFKEIFEPTNHNRYIYKVPNSAWLSSKDEKLSVKERIADNEYRIFVCLLAHEIWCDTIDKD